MEEPSPSPSPSLSDPVLDVLAHRQSQEITSCKPGSGSPTGDAVASKLSDLAHCIPNVNDRFPLPDYRKKLAENTLKSWQMLNDRRGLDLKSVLDVYEREEIPQTVSMRDIPAAIKTLQARVMFAATRAGGEAKNWQSFIGDQIADAGDDVVTNWIDEKGARHKDVEQGFFSRLGEESSNEARFKLLADRASQTDDGDSYDDDGHLTPYHAKMILIYNLENKLRAKYKNEPGKADSVLNALGSELYLKTDVTRGGPTQWQWVIPHDGFMLGASFQQMRNLLDPGAKPESQHGTGSGVDCATFAQNMLIATGYESAREKNIGRLTSAGVSRLNKLKGLASVERMSPAAAETLQPGDLIVEREKGDDIGHVQIVVGYDGDPPNLVVVSAEGGYQRAVIKRTIEVFPKQPRSCGREYTYSSDPTLFYFRATLQKEPQ